MTIENNPQHHAELVDVGDHPVVNTKCVAFGMLLMLVYYTGVASDKTLTLVYTAFDPWHLVAPLQWLVGGIVILSIYDSAFKCNNKQSNAKIFRHVAFGMMLVIIYSAGLIYKSPVSISNQFAKPEVVRDVLVSIALLVFGYLSMAHYDYMRECEKGGRMIKGPGWTGYLKPGGRRGKVSKPSEYKVLVYLIHVVGAMIITSLMRGDRWTEQIYYDLLQYILLALGSIAFIMHLLLLMVSGRRQDRQLHRRMVVIRLTHLLIGLVLICAGSSVVSTVVPIQVTLVCQLMIPTFSLLAVVYHGYMLYNFATEGKVIVDN